MRWAKIWITALLCLWLGAWVGIFDAWAANYEIRLSQIDTSRYPDITLYVSVLDDRGKQVGGLKREDFTVMEEGTAATLTSFAGVTEARPVDVVFVFDTTGSMGEEIEGMKRTAIEFARKLRANNRDFRLGLIDFGDEIRGVYHPNGSLTDDENEFRSWINRLRAYGGNDTPENSYGALKAAAGMSFRDEAQVVFILITDAPPHQYGDWPDGGVRFDDPDLTLARILVLLQPEAITLYPVAINIPEFRQLAAETGGRFYDMDRNSDFTSIIEEIGETIAGQYRLTYRSPRPSYDGTRRDIRVTVGEGSAAATSEGRYVERHLLHIESNWWIGLGLLLPLLMALLIPYIQQGRLGMPVNGTAGIIEAPLTHSCPRCQNSHQPNARFCGHCGYNLTMLPAPKVTNNCPRCQTLLRPEARFCPSCGFSTRP
jgi:Ca-activated chloride channel homolog